MNINFLQDFMKFSPKTRKIFFQKVYLYRKMRFLLLPFSYVNVWFQRPWENCSNRFYREIKIFNRKVTFFVIKNFRFRRSPIPGSEMYIIKKQDYIQFCFFIMGQSYVFFLSLRKISNFVISLPGGASDHKKDFKNEKFRRFAIGAVYRFFSWDGLSEKL